MSYWLGTVGAFVVGLLVTTQVFAASLIGNGDVFGNRATVLQARVDPSDTGAGQAGASLFAGRKGGGLFAPTPVRLQVDPVDALTRAPVQDPALAGSRTGVSGLRDIIAKAEAGPKGYDAVVWNARIMPPKAPTDMTVDEIFQWIKETPGQNHAIGRYQFIPATLRSLVKRIGVDGRQRFSPQLQDTLANALLEDAGLSGFVRGEVSRVAFMNNLAKIWAGLPNSSGRSHYHGYAGNKATMSWTTFKTKMAQVFPS